MQAVLLVILGVILGFQNHGGIEKKIAAELQKELHASHVDVKLDMSNMKFLSSGKVDGVNIAIFGYCPPEMCFDHYNVNVSGIKLSRTGVLFHKKVKLKSVESVDWDVQIKQEELQKYLRSRSALLRSAEVSVGKGSFRVRMAVLPSLFTANRFVEFTGNLVQDEGGIGLHVTDINTFGFKFGAGIIDELINMINPIVSNDTLNQQISQNSPYRDPGISYKMHVTDVTETKSLLGLKGDVVVTIADK